MLASRFLTSGFHLIPVTTRIWQQHPRGLTETTVVSETQERRCAMMSMRRSQVGLILLVVMPTIRAQDEAEQAEVGHIKSTPGIPDMAHVPGGTHRV